MKDVNQLNREVVDQYLKEKEQQDRDSNLKSKLFSEDVDHQELPDNNDFMADDQVDKVIEEDSLNSNYVQPKEEIVQDLEADKKVDPDNINVMDESYGEEYIHDVSMVSTDPENDELEDNRLEDSEESIEKTLEEDDDFLANDLDDGADDDDLDRYNN
ncbi:hypothetical protein [Flavobacterium frigidarium]|uniref:hypothetical protein n=1 Tax=Flavobacterium frigidarium TaxID=99286 RepID=UPI000417A198|nr:hypothetical protein [Flavobacterium frigidarium]